MKRLTQVALMVGVLTWGLFAWPTASTAEAADASGAPPPIPPNIPPPRPVVDWANRPTAADMAKFYPDRAQRMGVNGRAVLSCVAQADGALAACSVSQEEPADQGFGAAALKLADVFRLNLLGRDGRSVAGVRIILPILFGTPHGADVAVNREPAPPAPPPLYIRPPGGAVLERTTLARREGDRLLAEAHVEALFDNVTQTDVIRLRHRASGLVCAFYLGSANSISAGPDFSELGERESIHCTANNLGVSNTLTLSLNRRNLSIDQAVERAAAATRATMTDLAPFSGALLDLEWPTGSSIRSVRLQSSPDGAGLFVYLGATLSRGWIAVDRAIGVAYKGNFANLFGQTYLALAVANPSLTVGPRGNPTGRRSRPSS